MRRTFIKYANHLLIFFLLFFFGFVINSQVKLMTAIVGADSFGTLAGVAYFSGYDWSNLLAERVPYYGVGTGLAFSPIYRFIRNPVYAYHALLACNGVLLGLSGIFCYSLVKRFTSLTKACATITALACVCLPTTLFFVTAILNETMLIFLAWLIIYLFSLVAEKNTKRARFIFTALLGLTVTFSFLVHTRAILIACAILFAGMYARFILKQKIINLPLFSTIAATGYTLTYLYTKYIQRTYWLSSGNLDNTADGLLEAFRFIPLIFTSLNYFKGFLYSLIGRLYSLFSVTGGLACIALVALVFIIFNSPAQKNNHGIKICSMFILLLFLANWILISIASSEKTAIYIATGLADKWFTYLRYHGILAAPLLVIPIVYIINNKEKQKPILWISAGVYASIFAFFVLFISPYYEGTLPASGEFTYYAFSGIRQNEIMSRYTMIYMGLIGIVVFLFLFLFIYKSRALGAAILSLLYSLCVFGGTFLTSTIPVSESNYKLANATSAVYRHIKSENVYWFGNVQFLYAAQVLIKEDGLKTCNISDFFDSEEPCVVLSDKISHEHNKFLSLFENAYIGQLDSNEYILLRGDDYYNQISALGIPLYSTFSPLGNSILANLEPETPALLPASLFASENSILLAPHQKLSDGNPGYLLYGPAYEFDAGEYDVSIKLILAEPPGENAVCRVEVFLDAAPIFNREASVSDFTQDDTAEFSIPLHLSATSKVIFRVYVYGGAQVKTNGFVVLKSVN